MKKEEVHEQKEEKENEVEVYEYERVHVYVHTVMWSIIWKYVICKFACIEHNLCIYVNI